jgi:hypothetical protein
MVAGVRWQVVFAAVLATTTGAGLPERSATETLAIAWLDGLAA